MKLNFLKTNINIDFSKYLSKKEREFIKSLDIKEKNITISLEKFIKDYNLVSEEEVIKFFTSLLNKYIILSSKPDNYISYISILQSFQIIEDKITFTFSDEILSSFKKETYFEKLGINKILTFEEKFSYKLFQYLKHRSENIIFISLEDLRELLEIKESYKRFYDIEKNILLPILKDLNENGNMYITYNKNKSGEYKTARILGVTFKKENSDIKNSAINEIMQLISHKINDFSEIYNLIINNLSEHGEEYVRENVEFALNNSSGNFDIYLKKLFNRELIVKKPYLTIKKKFKSLFDLHMEVLKIAQKESDYPSNLKFLIKIYSLKDGDSIICDGKDIYLKIAYSKNSISLIEIFHQDI